MSEQSKTPVGYMSPPAHTRFKKGKSGNAKGRPKKQEDIWQLNERIHGNLLKTIDRNKAKYPNIEAATKLYAINRGIIKE